MNKLKNFLKFVTLSLGLLGACTALAGASSDLKARLQSFEALSCNFEQEVLKSNGAVVSTSQGRLLVAKPDRLMMYTASPDEQYLFTKDEAVYFYDPFVNQVSIFSVADLNTAPFLLLNSSDPKLWAQYTVKSKGESFSLKPKSSKEFQEIELNFNGKTLESLVILMKNGNKNIYKLSSQQNQVNMQDFEVAIPDDAEVDDERRSH